MNGVKESRLIFKVKLLYYSVLAPNCALGLHTVYIQWFLCEFHSEWKDVLPASPAGLSTRASWLKSVSINKMGFSLLSSGYWCDMEQDVPPAGWRIILKKNWWRHITKRRSTNITNLWLHILVKQMLTKHRPPQFNTFYSMLVNQCKYVIHVTKPSRHFNQISPILNHYIYMLSCRS